MEIVVLVWAVKNWYELNKFDIEKHEKKIINSLIKFFKKQTKKIKDEKN
jgi:hypothetical protein